MDDHRFDHLTRRLGAAITRRRGIAGMLGTLAGVAGISVADANVAGPPVDCRSTGMQCLSGDECCSGRCLLKHDGTSRCSRKTSNRKKKNSKKKGGGSTPVPPPAPACTVCASGCAYTTIEEAILNAASGSEVTIYQGTYTPTNTSQPQSEWAILINKTLTVKACDANTEDVIIRPQNEKYVFKISNEDTSTLCLQQSMTVVMDGLVLDGTGATNTSAMLIGCPLNGGAVTLDNIEVMGFTGTSQRSTIRIFSASPVTFNDCHFHDNDGYPDSYDGGSVLTNKAGGTNTIHNTLIENNRNRSGGFRGGIVGMNSSGVLALTGTTEIKNNTVEGLANGGGVYCSISQTPNWGMESTVKIHNNTGASAGGGIAAYTEPTAGSVVDNTTVYNNTATTCNNVYITSNSTCN